MADVIYRDKLVAITPDHLVFRHYYFPVGSKKISFEDIESVETLKPTLFSGKWRIHGTGDFRTWFPLDAKRPTRDVIFIMTLRRRWWRIGFTVERSDKVRRIFEEKGLMQPNQKE